MSKGWKWFLAAVLLGAAWAIGSKLVDRYFPAGKDNTLGATDRDRTNNNNA
jgi:hypothetical protein